jgi:sugar lactone lactonase YvrE
MIAAALLVACGGGGDDSGPADDAGVEVADAGFMTPESIVHDAVADVYFVSNINGGPLDEDDNGFISRVTPDGQVENLRWIDGANPSFNLHAPKGMAIRGDTLFVADINTVRLFNRATGEAIERIDIEGATFLNDVAIAPDGNTLYVTDTGVQGNDMRPAGTDAVYRIAVRPGAGGETIAKNADLGGPNGIAVGSRGVWVGTFGSGEILNFGAENVKTVVMGRSNRQIDGIVILPDGFAFSSWGDSAVYYVPFAGGTLTSLVTGIEAPADIGYDSRRNRLLIPQFMANKVLIRDLPSNDPAGGTG